MTELARFSPHNKVEISTITRYGDMKDDVKCEIGVVWGG